ERVLDLFECFATGHVGGTGATGKRRARLQQVPTHLVLQAIPLGRRGPARVTRPHPSAEGCRRQLPGPCGSKIGADEGKGNQGYRQGRLQQIPSIHRSSPVPGTCPSAFSGSSNGGDKCRIGYACEALRAPTGNRSIPRFWAP